MDLANNTTSSSVSCSFFGLRAFFMICLIPCNMLLFASTLLSFEAILREVESIRKQKKKKKKKTKKNKKI